MFRGNPYAYNSSLDYYRSSDRHMGFDPYLDMRYERWSNHPPFVNAPLHPYTPHPAYAFLQQESYHGSQIDRSYPSVYSDDDDDFLLPPKPKEKAQEAPEKRGRPIRRHSIGSGHSRESIMSEISTAMEQEYKMGTCSFCGHLASRCICGAQYSYGESIIDISHHTDHSRRQRRGRQSPIVHGCRGLENRLSSSAVLQSSRFNASGGRYMGSSHSRGSRTAHGRLRQRESAMLEAERYWRGHPFAWPFSRPPENFEQNDYMYAARVERPSH